MNLMPAFSVGILTSPILMTSSNSWFSTWIAMEVNSLSFTMMEKTKKNKWNKDSMIKYFIIQSVASSMVVMIMLIGSKVTMKETAEAVATAAIMMKMASAPVHQWMVEIIKKMEKATATVLMTWQKAIPILLIHNLNNKLSTPFCLTTGAIGVLSQMKTKQTMKMMAFSSVFNNGWSILATMTKTIVMTSFVAIYWSTVILMMKLVKNNKTSMEETSKWENFMSTTNMAGMPPTAGFSAKISVLSTTLKKKMTTVSFILTVITTVNLYAYTKMVMKSLLEKKSKKATKRSENSSLVLSSSLVSNFLIIS